MTGPNPSRSARCSDAITDPYKAVAIDVTALKANPNLPGAFTVTGVVYDVKTGLVEIVVPPAMLRPELSQAPAT
ncbi:Carbonic anhydrase [Caballeronia sordidicola]|uniref:Carbonic anhydrase n=1 Tax=Caballeronia sordidicola TaxID=196367 RepID=A0A242MGG2_CABSO|nr:Carbonic anhydrase [Caballeronia sordidicola]